MKIPEVLQFEVWFYLLWDLPCRRTEKLMAKWTSIQVSPQQVIELGPGARYIECCI